MKALIGIKAFYFFGSVSVRFRCVCEMAFTCKDFVPIPLTCEELVPIPITSEEFVPFPLICEELVPNSLTYKNWN